MSFSERYRTSCAGLVGEPAAKRVGFLVVWSVRMARERCCEGTSRYQVPVRLRLVSREQFVRFKRLPRTELNLRRFARLQVDQPRSPVLAFAPAVVCLDCRATAQRMVHCSEFPGGDPLLLGNAADSYLLQEPVL